MGVLSTLGIGGVTAAVGTIRDTVDQFVETPDEKRDYRKFLDTIQTDINKIEAGHSNIFVAGWRPFIGWTCGVGLAWQWVGLPVVTSLVQIAAYALGATPFDVALLPKLDTNELLTCVTGLLGLAGLRTYEKYQGVENKR